MAQKTALALSAGITAFVLVLVAAICFYTARPEVTAAANDTVITEPTLTPIDSAATDPQLLTLTKEREATYRQQLDRANQQLAQANVQLQEAYDKLNSLSTPQPAPTAPLAPEPTRQLAPATYPVSPAQATAIASAFAHDGSLSRLPDLVSFQGIVSYEVQLASGTLYIDATSGEVLYSSIAGASVPSPLLDVSPGAIREQEFRENHDEGEDD